MERRRPRVHTDVVALGLALAAWGVLVTGAGGLALSSAGQRDGGIFLVDGVLRGVYWAPVVVSGVMAAAAAVMALWSLGLLQSERPAGSSGNRRRVALAALVLVAVPPCVALLAIGGAGNT